MQCRFVMHVALVTAADLLQQLCDLLIALCYEHHPVDHPRGEQYCAYEWTRHLHVRPTLQLQCQGTALRTSLSVNQYKCWQDNKLDTGICESSQQLRYPKEVCLVSMKAGRKLIKIEHDTTFGGKVSLMCQQCSFARFGNVDSFKHAHHAIRQSLLAPFPVSRISLPHFHEWDLTAVHVPHAVKLIQL